MLHPLVDPRLLSRLGDFFPHTVTVRAMDGSAVSNDETNWDYGTMVLEAAPCSFKPAPSGEQPGQFETEEAVNDKILLQTPTEADQTAAQAIKAKMKAILKLSGQSTERWFTIADVQPDASGATLLLVTPD